jgi:putative addiction module killer protein
MPAIKETEEFSSWINDLRDNTAKAKILVRIQRLANGNPGDVGPVGKGISELRIHHGIQRGDEFVILLCGGDKSSQTSDIAKAKELVDELEE